MWGKNNINASNSLNSDLRGIVAAQTSTLNSTILYNASFVKFYLSQVASTVALSCDSTVDQPPDDYGFWRDKHFSCNFFSFLVTFITTYSHIHATFLQVFSPFFFFSSSVYSFCNTSPAFALAEFHRSWQTGFLLILIKTKQPRRFTNRIFHFVIVTCFHFSMFVF